VVSGPSNRSDGLAALWGLGDRRVEDDVVASSACGAWPLARNNLVPGLDHLTDPRASADRTTSNNIVLTSVFEVFGLTIYYM